MTLTVQPEHYLASSEIHLVAGMNDIQCPPHRVDVSMKIIKLAIKFHLPASHPRPASLSVAHAQRVDRREQDVRRARGLERVHDGGRLGLLDQGGHGDPGLVLEGLDRGRLLARRDLPRDVQEVARHVVRHHHVARRRDEARDALPQELDEVLVVRVRVRDQHRLRVHDDRHLLEARGAHRRARLDEVDDAVGEAEAARRLDAPRDALDLGLGAGLEAREVLLREHRERRHDALARELPRVLRRARGRLHAQPALAHAEPHELDDVDLALGDDVLARDAHVHVALAHVGRDVRRRQEDERHGQVAAVRDVEARLALVLEARALEHAHDLLVQPALLRHAEEQLAPPVVALRVRHELRVAGRLARPRAVVRRRRRRRDGRARGGESDAVHCLIGCWPVATRSA